VATPEPLRAFSAEPYDFGAARALARELGVSEPTAVTLVRRGYVSADDARAFLEAAELHDPFEFRGMERIADRLLAAVSEGLPITVHGDFDVDGVCSTAILVRALRDLGGQCDWYLPDRLADGYGLRAKTIDRLAERGTRLLLTADCGITSAPEVKAARAAGMEVIVTDHHAPSERLPDCPILHPVVSAYPCPDLCATGVAYKLSAAVRIRAGRDPAEADRDLDLVALATVADLVPLRGENRALVRRGLDVARAARRPGMRALLAASKTDPSGLTETDLGFRLAPRINAAGRLYRADAGVELMLTDDDARAGQIAAELDRANQERRFAERAVLNEAERAVAALSADDADAPALVLAGEGWHPGVIGIVASRLVDRHWRPVILIALDGAGGGRGSGRSIPAFDLVGALRECSEHLTGFGGHAAAAGLEIEAAAVGPFAKAFRAHAARRLSLEDLVRRERVDAVVGGESLGYELAEELERLRPFGAGNPEVRLLVPSAHLRDVRPMGDRKHARFSIESGRARALGVAFGTGGTVPGGDGPLDVAVRLELNRWNGSVEPRVVLRECFPVAEPEQGPVSCAEGECGAGDEEWWRRVEAECRTSPDSGSPGASTPVRAKREVVDRRAGSAMATLAALAWSGETVLAVCADTQRRRLLAERIAGAGRPAEGPLTLACGRCADQPLRGRLAERARVGGLALADWRALERFPEACLDFEHVVVVDPPHLAHLEERAAAACAIPATSGFLHLAWGPAEVEFASRVLADEFDLQGQVGSIAGALAGEREPPQGRLREALEGGARYSRTPEQAGRCLRVLEELGLVSLTPGGWELGVVSSEVEPESSPAYVKYRERHSEAQRFLSRQREAP
jgi:single-stranded-DNA-specific exonuclease